jgi:hypothetical protein
MLSRLRATLDPARYHGSGAGRPFFEGWYFKVVDSTETARYAIIPGVFYGRDPAKDHAFIQLLDGATGQVTYTSFPVEQFRSSGNRFAIAIGPNRFSANEVSLALQGPDTTVQGRLRFLETNPWPVSLLSPGIMGWYAWVPFMECYHGVVSLDHPIEGSLTMDGREIDFEGGRGYIEKDWGRSFPAAWIWCQSNHFQRPGTSLTASLAVVPWLRGAFPGFTVGLWHGRRLYRFATYTGARTELLRVADKEIDWVVADRRHRLELHLARASGGLLQAPTGVDMDRRIAESLSATVALRLLALGGPAPKVVFEGTGRHAGLEAAGDLARLQAGQ